MDTTGTIGETIYNRLKAGETIRVQEVAIGWVTTVAPTGNGWTWTETDNEARVRDEDTTRDDNTLLDWACALARQLEHDPHAGLPQDEYVELPAEQS